MVEPPPSVVHRFDPELSQLRHALAICWIISGGALPARYVLDDPEWLSRLVGPCRAPGEALVGDVRVVFDRAEWLDPAPSRMAVRWMCLA